MEREHDPEGRSPSLSRRPVEAGHLTIVCGCNRPAGCNRQQVACVTSVTLTAFGLDQMCFKMFRNSVFEVFLPLQGMK